MRKNKLLLIAYHFPPIQGSTGTNRTLAFCKYLTRIGWEVRVLTIVPGAYEDTVEENLRLIPEGIVVCRAWGIDSRQRLSLFGRYPLVAALPDRWQSWVAGAFVAGSRVVKHWQPDVLMSTYPIASAHLIGYLLARRFTIPWIAEFRDPMLQSNYPSTRLERWAFGKVEELVFRHAARIVVTTNGCRRLYEERFSQRFSPDISVISNGYDPELFLNLNHEAPRQDSQRPFVLLHSGLLYPHERNPTAFFSAVRHLLLDGVFDRIRAEFHFRAPGNEDSYRNQLVQLGIDSVVRILPRVSYREALAEIMTADALMIFQAANCNDQIPAKLYEYLHSCKPILALTDPTGDTATLLHDLGSEAIAKLEDASAIASLLKDFLVRLKGGQAYIVPEQSTRNFTREALTRQLADILNESLIFGEAK